MSVRTANSLSLQALVCTDRSENSRGICTKSQDQIKIQDQLRATSYFDEASITPTITLDFCSNLQTKYVSVVIEFSSKRLVCVNFLIISSFLFLLFKLINTLSQIAR